MQIVLPHEVEAIVQRQVANGKYGNALEVILAALALNNISTAKTAFERIFCEPILFLTNTANLWETTFT